MELFEELDKYGIFPIFISKDEWKKEYSNNYNILFLNDNEEDLILAAQSIISKYLLLEAKKDEEETYHISLLRKAGCDCVDVLLGYRPNIGPRCRMCNTVAKIE